MDDKSMQVVPGRSVGFMGTYSYIAGRRLTS